MADTDNLTHREVAAAWYPDPDPSGQGGQRWWDEAQWTEHTRPAPMSPPGVSVPTPGTHGGAYAHQPLPAGREKASIALVCAVVGLLLPLLAVIAVVMGAAARHDARRAGRAASGKMNAAFITGIVATAIWSIVAVATIAGGGTSTSSPSSTPQASGSASPERTVQANAEGAVEKPAPTPDGPVAPAVVVLRGAGAQVRSLRLRADTPLVVTGLHRGSSNFIVDLVGSGATGGVDESLFNEIGSYRGQMLVSEVASGRYRVRLEADGPWTLRLAQPVPGDPAASLPGTLNGAGAKVVPVAVGHEGFQPVVNATHRGQSNFIVDVVGYGEDAQGFQENLYNEIGRYSGQTLMEDTMPDGGYLVAVVADGPWQLKFSR
jgi:hypothetical protein